MGKDAAGPQARRERFLKIRQVAEELGVGERSVWRFIERGELRVHTFGASTRVEREDLEQFISKRQCPQ